MRAGKATVTLSTEAWRCLHRSIWQCLWFIPVYLPATAGCHLHNDNYAEELEPNFQEKGKGYNIDLGWVGILAIMTSQYLPMTEDSSSWTIYIWHASRTNGSLRIFGRNDLSWQKKISRKLVLIRPITTSKSILTHQKVKPWELQSEIHTPKSTHMLITILSFTLGADIAKHRASISAPLKVRW